MADKTSTTNEPRPRKKRAWGTLAGTALDADSPRPLTALTTALVSRRRARVTTEAPSRESKGATPSHASVATKDGTLTYDLSAVKGGVLVQRTTCRRAGLQLCQTFHFTGAEDFDRWCRADPLRFEEPLLWESLLRQGHELLDANP